MTGADQVRQAPGPTAQRGRTGVTAVLLSWNDGDRVVAFLAQLAALEPGPDRILIVDNGSVDDSRERIERVLSSSPEHGLIALPDNHGFAGAVNRGVEVALDGGADWVWIMNTDLEVAPDTLAQLLAAAEAPGCGMVAPVLIEADGDVQAFGGGRVNLWTGVSRHITSEAEAPDYLCGACLLLRAAMLDQIGLLDEAYFFYWEDADLGFRARQAGWSLIVAASCRVLHLEGSTLGRWSSARWYHLFFGLPRFLQNRSALPTLAVAARLLHHSAAMARHRRWSALLGAWQGAGAGWMARRSPQPRSGAIGDAAQR